jgi:hypothetical protein
MKHFNFRLALYGAVLCAAWSDAARAATDVPLFQRMAAAQTTAQSSASCIAAQPFYWEVGNSKRLLMGGQAGTDAPTRQTAMSIASASKWIYSSYVAERRAGQLTDEDVRFLNFESGYTRFRTCLKSQTVQACQESVLNGLGRIDLSTVGHFYYSGGHMQKHATLMGLGPLGADGLATAIRLGLSPLGSDWAFSYGQPQLAGGGVTSAKDYARFLQGLMSGELQMGKLLGTHAVCTNPATCASAIKTPIPETESWHYSLGHWVEDDPVSGDGSFSSPGAFGFYPWIDAGRQFYGIVARESHDGVASGDVSEKPAVASVDCGRLIRAAWMDGHARP